MFEKATSATTVSCLRRDLEEGAAEEPTRPPASLAQSAVNILMRGGGVVQQHSFDFMDEGSREALPTR